VADRLHAAITDPTAQRVRTDTDPACRLGTERYCVGRLGTSSVHGRPATGPFRGLSSPATSATCVTAVARSMGWPSSGDSYRAKAVPGCAGPKNKPYSRSPACLGRDSFSDSMVAR
jgi:hypothetical protein